MSTQDDINSAKYWLDSGDSIFQSVCLTQKSEKWWQIINSSSEVSIQGLGKDDVESLCVELNQAIDRVLKKKQKEMALKAKKCLSKVKP